MKESEMSNSIVYETWKRHRLDRRYHWTRKYKLAKGCEICGWKPNEKYTELHDPKYLGCGFVFDHIDQLTKNPLTIGHRGNGTGMKTLVQRVSKNSYKNRQRLRDLVNEIRKCRVVCSSCHDIMSQSQATKSQEMYELRTGKRWSSTWTNVSDQIKPSSNLLNFIT